MSTAAPVLLRRLPLACAVDEFALTTVLLFLTVTVVRWLRAPASPLYIADLYLALAVIGVVSGSILTALILSPPGRRSGGHMNPAVTTALWVMDVFPTPSLVPYIVAQLAGSVTGTALARLVWGSAVAQPSVDYGVIRHAPTWGPALVFLTETGCFLVLAVLVGCLLAHPATARYLPYVIGLFVATVIALLGPRSGGSINPIRQFGPATISGETADLWIYLTGPILGTVLGASVQHMLIRRFGTGSPRTYKLQESH